MHTAMISHDSRAIFSMEKTTDRISDDNTSGDSTSEIYACGNEVCILQGFRMIHVLHCHRKKNDRTSDDNTSGDSTSVTYSTRRRCMLAKMLSGSVVRLLWFSVLQTHTPKTLLIPHVGVQN